MTFMFLICKLIILSVMELLFPWEGEDIKNILLFTIPVIWILWFSCWWVVNELVMVGCWTI